MSRFFPVMFLMLITPLSQGMPVADEPAKKLTEEERKEAEAKWIEQNDRGVQAFNQGKVAEARTAWVSALEMARRLYPRTEFPDGHKDLATSLNNLAILSQREGKYAESEQLCRESLEIRKRLYKDDHASIVNGLNTLAGLCHYQGKYADAEAHFRDALAMSKRLVKGDNANIARCMSNLADTLNAQKKYKEAEPLFREALDMRRRLFKGDHPELALNLESLAEFQRALNQFAEAERLCREALDMRRRMLKGDHPDLAIGMGRLGSVYQSMGKFAEAEPIYRDALAMDRRLYPGDHPHVVHLLTSLAEVFKFLEKYTEAEPFYRDALAMARRVYRGDHPHIAYILTSQAEACQIVRRYAEAERLHRESLEMRNRMFKGDHSEVVDGLMRMMELHRCQGNFQEAERISRDALAMSRRLFAGNHPSNGECLRKLASICEDTGRYAEAEGLFRDVRDMYERIYKEESIQGLDDLARMHHLQGRYSDADRLYRAALEARRRRYGGNDHPEVAKSMKHLGILCLDRGNFAEAEQLFRDAFEMSTRLYRGDHPTIADCLINMTSVRASQGKYSEAGPYGRDALLMYQRLYPGGHVNVADCLNNLGVIHFRAGLYAQAEPLCRDALAMYRRIFTGDHPKVAIGMNNLAQPLVALGKYVEAEDLMRNALEMRKRFFPGDHPAVAASLHNLAHVITYQGRYVEADNLLQNAHDMYVRLFAGDHDFVAMSLAGIASLHAYQGRFNEAVTTYRKSLEMYRRLVISYSAGRAEGAALTIIASLQRPHDRFISAAREAHADPASIYQEFWASKGSIARIYEQRLHAARVADANPAAASLVIELAQSRRQRADLLIAPVAKDQATCTKQKAELAALDEKIAKLDREICSKLPSVDRVNRLNDAVPIELQKKLPADAAMIDFLHYHYHEFDSKKPGKAGERMTARYSVFVLTREKVVWLDLEESDEIDATVTAWREAIAVGMEMPPALPAKVRALAWQKIERELPSGIKVLYISPDRNLCRIPWTAIPGRKPGTVLLDDYAIATIPHAQFLLDKLLPQDPPKNPPANALVVGGVAYDAAVQGNAKTVVSRGEPLLKADTTPVWPFLPGTVGELNGVAATAEQKRVPITRLTGEGATPQAILAALPKAKYAHIATHGFFADSSFRSAFQLDENEFAIAQWGERIGRAANSPLVMTGLVFAGANNPKTPGRGILTGESLVDLDLSGLELAVLSACETGLGDVAGGEGTFGLQRAFHMAGTRDVVASLWKVPDQSTAALMALFYRNLWERNLSPMESLRQAQLEIYRNPGKIGELAKGFRGKFEEVAGKGGVEIKPSKDGTAHPLLWAAFTLSGPGR